MATNTITVAELTALQKGTTVYPSKATSNCSDFGGNVNVGCIIYRDEFAADGSNRSTFQPIPYGQHRDLRIFNLPSGKSWHDAVDAVRLAPNTVVIVYTGENFTGGAVTIANARASCAVNATTFGAMGLHDKADSVKVYRLRPANEVAFALCNKATAFENGPYQKGSPLCQDTVTPDYCVAEKGALKDSNCRQWCKSNTGQCDAMMAEYCQTAAGFATPICSCLNSPTLNVSSILAPQFLDVNCMRDGYVNSTMKNVTSVNNLDCRQQQDLKTEAGAVLVGNAFNSSQNCSLTSNSGGVTTVSEAPMTTVAPMAPTGASRAKYYAIAAACVCGVVILAGVGTAMARSRRSHRRRR